MDKLADKIVNEFEMHRSLRSLYENPWQEIKDLVRPGAPSFNRNTVPGDLGTEYIYDSTAVQCCVQLAGGLQSYLTGPSERWFNITTQDPDILDDDEVLFWLEVVSNAVFTAYSLDSVNFNPQLFEQYKDLAGFGNGVIYQDWDVYHNRLRFRSFPLADCFFAENFQGQVDTLYRRCFYNRRQAIQEFGQDTLPQKLLDEKDSSKKFTFIHAVYPRTDRQYGRLDSKGHAYASCWVSLEFKQVVKESGFKQFPYHVPRWDKSSGEVYGRGPAHNCLGDIKMLNLMEKYHLKSVQKNVDPPLMSPDDGFIMPIRTSPGSIIFYESGTQDRLEPLETKARPELSFETNEQKRESIRQAFYIDLLRMFRKKERQTAYEIADFRDEGLRILGPMIFRAQSELLGPMLRRTYELLWEAGMLPPPPERLAKGSQLKIEYISPAAKAQTGAQSLNVSRFLQDLLPLYQINPEIVDVINWDEYTKRMAIWRDVSRTVIRPQQLIEQIREERKAQQQIAQAAEVGATAAGAVKDLAQAQAISAAQ